MNLGIFASPDTKPMTRTIKLQAATTGILFSLLTIFSTAAIAQDVRGTVTDADTKEPLFGTSVVIEGTAVGATTDFDGKFKFTPDRQPPFTLVVSYIGYKRTEIQVTSLATPIQVALETDRVMLKGVEIVDTRISEKQKESALTVESMDIIAIKETPAANFYEGLGNLKGVDLTSASIGFKIINTRGFNSTSPVRSLQIIDGVDNQSPGLNFSLGNFLGASELDVMKVEIVQGASSAFFGPNAFNGVIDMRTRNPFIKPGLSTQIKVGERGLTETAVRWAQVFKNKDGVDKFAYKINLFYLQARDWEADNINPVDGSPVGIDNPGGYDAVNRYGDEDLAGGNNFTNQVSGYPGLGIFHRAGYMERDLVDYNTRNLKTNLAMHYRLKEDLELIYSFNFGSGTTVYQGENRFSLRDILFFQNRIEINKRDKWFVRAYSTNEDAGRSYDAVVTAFKMLNGQRSLESYNTAYANYWSSDIRPQVRALLASEGITFGGVGVGWDVNAINSVLAQYPDLLAAWHQEAASAVADNPNIQQGEGFYPQPGTPEFEALKNSITNATYTDSRIEGGGAMFYDKSALYHVHGEYKLDATIKDVYIGQFTFGANARLYAPDSRGTIFDELRTSERMVEVPTSTGTRDSLVIDTTYRTITNFEFGVYAGWDRKFFRDKLKASITLRMDKNENFPFLFSPAASLVYMPNNNHTLRLGFSSAIRNPTLSDQYLHYDVGRAVLLGNISGYQDLITVESFRNYLNTGRNRDSLVYFDVAPIVPEKVKSLEVGYRGFFFGRIYADASYYISLYDDFIGFQLGVKSEFDTILGLPQNPKAYRVSTNSRNQVVTQGFSIALSYNFFNKYSLSGNYSWNRLEKLDEDDPIIPAFNTPEHKFNLGLSGRDLGTDRLGHFGFSFNYKWIQGFIFEGSPQFTGFVPSYDMFDAQVSYRIPKDYVTFKLGVSNLFGIMPFFEDGTVGERFENAFDNRNVQVYGGPQVGRLAYFSVLFEWN
jgi:iron complex outermembrane receptor protein